MKSFKGPSPTTKNKRADQPAPTHRINSPPPPTPASPRSPPRPATRVLRVQPLGFADAKNKQQQQYNRYGDQNQPRVAPAGQAPPTLDINIEPFPVSRGYLTNIAPYHDAEPSPPSSKCTELITRPSRPYRKSAKVSHRRKIGKRGRPSKKRLEELFGPHENCRVEHSAVQDELEKAREEIQALKDLVAAKEKQLAAVERVNTVVDMLRKTGLELRRTHIRTALVLSAQTPDEMAAIKQKENILHNLARKARTHRQQLAFDHGVDGVDDLRTPALIKPDDINIGNFQILVFGVGALRCVTDSMVFFTNPHFPIAGARVVAAFADGKFSSCVRGWKQSFELRLLLVRDFASPFACTFGNRRPTEHFTATFAFALLRGTSQRNYAEFFAAAHRHGCPPPPLLMTDFELAIGGAAQQIWPTTIGRGCFFHFAANLRDQAAKLSMWFRAEPSTQTRNVLALAPFLHHLPLILVSYIDHLNLDEQALLRSCDFKLVLYVFDTYMTRFKRLFWADLDQLRLRTNNACEASNSGVARTHSFRLSLQDFLDVAEERFKMDAAAIWENPRTDTEYGDFIILIQQHSRTNPLDVLRFLITSPPVNGPRSAELLKSLRLFKFGPAQTPSADTLLDADRRLQSFSASLALFRRSKRRKSPHPKRATRTGTASYGGVTGRGAHRRRWALFDHSQAGSAFEDSADEDAHADESKQNKRAVCKRKTPVGTADSQRADTERTAATNNNSSINNDNSNANNTNNNNNDNNNNRNGNANANSNANNKKHDNKRN